jgi:serine/threonine protein kinase/Tfp pilus assembly protein PilF
MNERRDPNVTSDYLPSEVSQDSTKQESPAGEDTKAFILAENAKESRALPQITGYVVQREIARGGMGRVLAALDTTLDRDVAIKILMPGAPPDRFIRESQITARLPHPGIPPVYSLGELPDGSPYLAMKLIDGRTLVSEIKDGDRQQLLQIYLQICQAVGFAHSRGIIHRDLKPANVMVGAFGEVQVMDWGLAKEVASSETSALAEIDDTRVSGNTIRYQNSPAPAYEQTELGVVMGTPSYMSPEQARGEPLDARVDVFALGGILYSILTKSPPFMGNTSAEVLKKAATADLKETFQKLNSCDADPDLLAICRKCLSANPADRPADGQAVAASISAHLSNLQSRLREAEIASAQAAERETAAKRTRKIQIIAASLVFTALAVGLGISLWQYREASKALSRALFAEGQERTRSGELAKSEAKERERADELSKVAKYQGDMLKQVNPKEAGVRLMKDLLARYRAAVDKTDLPDAEKLQKKAAFENELYVVNATDAAVELIDTVLLIPAVNTIDSEFAKQPLVDASLRNTLAEVYENLGRNDQALALSKQSYDLRKRMIGDTQVDTLKSRLQFATALITAQDFRNAESDIRAVLGESRKQLGDDSELTLEANTQLARVLNDQGNYRESVALAREILTRRRRLNTSDPEDAIRSANRLGTYLIDNGKYEEALTHLTEQLEMESMASEPSGETLSLIAVAHLRMYDFLKAEPYLRSAVDVQRKKHGEDHPSTVSAISILAEALMETPKLAEAQLLGAEALEKIRQMRGKEHLDTLKYTNIFGQILLRQNKFKEAEPFFREAYQTGRRVLGSSHPEVIVFTHNLATVQHRLGNFADADPLYREALELNRRRLGEDHPHTIISTKILADFLRQVRKHAEAEKFLRIAIDSLKRNAGGQETAEVILLLGTLGAVCRDQGKLTETEECFQKVVDWNLRVHGPEHPDSIIATLRMATLRVAQGNHEAALAILTPMDGKISQAFPVNVGPLRQASLSGLMGKSRLALAKEDADYQLAEKSLLEAQSIFSKSRGDKDKETVEWITALADLYTKWNEASPNSGHDKSAETWKAKLTP